MASKEMTYRQWKCDGCSTTLNAADNRQELPPGWTSAATTINIPPGGPYTKGLDLCPACSKDPEAAAKRYKASLSQ